MEKSNEKKYLNYPLNFKNNKKTSIGKNKNILFCTSNTNLYAYRIQDYVISSQIVECFKFWKNLFVSMSDNIKDKIVIRHVPNFDPWNQRKTK